MNIGKLVASLHKEQVDPLNFYLTPDVQRLQHPPTLHLIRKWEADGRHHEEMMPKRLWTQG